MPGALDSCISSVYEDGNIPASSGLDPVRVLLKDALDAAVSETAAAADTQDVTAPALTEMDAMLPGVFVNSDGTPRHAMVGDVMVNL